MDKQKLMDKLHDMQNKDLEEMKKYDVGERKWAYLHGRIMACFDIVENFLLGED